MILEGGLKNPPYVKKENKMKSGKVIYHNSDLEMEVIVYPDGSLRFLSGHNQPISLPDVKTMERICKRANEYLKFYEDCKEEEHDLQPISKLLAKATSDLLNIIRK